MAKTHTSFKKGDPRINRKGAPKKEWTMAGLLKQALEEQDETGVPYKVAINRKLTQLAKRGDIAAIKEINNRIDGMPTQKTELTGENGGNIGLKFVIEANGYQNPKHRIDDATPSASIKGPDEVQSLDMAQEG